MYEAFFELKTRPFLTVPDPDFLFWSEKHAMAFTMLRYGLMSRSPITVITGQIGSGKTTLVRQLLREAPGDLLVGLVSNMQAGRGDVLSWVMMALGEPVECTGYVQLFKRFQDFVVAAYARGLRVALIIDEAQNLDVSTLEELRMLSNINADKDELLQIILVGQPQLRDLLHRPELVQFAQRISSDFHLAELSASETHDYISHRLAQAGAVWRIFTRSSCDLVHEASGGVPRLINILCDLCLVYGYAAESKVIEPPLLREFLDGARRRGIYEQFRPLEGAAKLIRQV